MDNRGKKGATNNPQRELNGENEKMRQREREKNETKTKMFQFVHFVASGLTESMNRTKSDQADSMIL